MSHISLSRRQVFSSALAFSSATALNSLFPRVANAQIFEGIGFMDALLMTPDVIDSGLDTSRESTLDQLQTIARQSSALVNAQTTILEKVRALKITVSQEIERAFHENHLRHLNAEIDDFRIMTANGKLPNAGRHVREKAERMEDLSIQMGRYGPIALPSFAAVNSILYTLNKTLDRPNNYVAKTYSSHADTLDSWLKEENEFMQRFLDEYRVQSGLALTARAPNKLQKVNVGSASYRLEDQVLVSSLGLLVLRETHGTKALIKPKIYEYSTVLNNMDLEEEFVYGTTDNRKHAISTLDHGEVLISSSNLPQEFTDAFPRLSKTSDKLIVGSDDQAELDQAIASWLQENIVDIVQESANHYVSDMPQSDERFKSLIAYINAVESSSEILRTALNKLAAPQIIDKQKRKTVIAPLPVFPDYSNQ